MNKLLVTDREKAIAIITEYTKVNRRPRDKENGMKIKHEVNNFCRTYCNTCSTENNNMLQKFHIRRSAKSEKQSIIINLTDQARQIISMHNKQILKTLIMFKLCGKLEE